MNVDGYTVIRFLPSGRVQLQDSTGAIFTASVAVDGDGMLRIL